jgi:hypothetical protein
LKEKNMAVFELLVKSIDIHNTDEDDSEWHLNIGADNWSNSMNFWWNGDEGVRGVSDFDHYEINAKEQFRIEPGQKIFIHAGGFEEDDPGIPLFDDNDGLPGFGFEIDPFALEPGDDYAVSAAAGDFHYTLHWDIIPW